MSVPSSQILIPTSQIYSKIEPAFTQCEKGDDYVIPVAWGPLSRVIGNCTEFRLGTGQCVGAFWSRDVNASDTPYSCIGQENKVVNICGVTNPGTVLPQPAPPVAPLPSNSNNGKNSMPVPPLPMVARSLKNLPKMNTARASNAPKSINDDYFQPYINGSNPYLSFDVFDKAYLSRGTQSTSDPAGYLTGIATYTALQRQAEQSSILPDEPWGSCSSYGSYSLAPQTSLSSNNCISGSCLAGAYGQTLAQTRAQMKAINY